MNNSKIYDCITFFKENLLTNTRFEILNDVVDYFVICESEYDHNGDKKEINFKLINPKFKKKIRHIIIKENFPDPKGGWSIEKYQREKIIDALYDANDNDLIMYSDADEIPKPEILKNINLKNKFGIFLQKFYVYKLNIYNDYETPWQGTRICKKKDLKSITYLRKKVKMENLKKAFWKFYYEKNIQIFEDGGWHFNNFYDVETISVKLINFQNVDKGLKKANTSHNQIKKKIENLEDLFYRNHKYKKIEIDKELPNYIKNNLNLFENYILK